VDIFLTKSMGMKGFFTLKFRKDGWSEQNKVVSECILKYNFFIQMYCMRSENISD